MESSPCENDVSCVQSPDDSALPVAAAEAVGENERATDCQDAQEHSVAQPNPADSTPSRNDILLKTRAVVQTLEALRGEHVQMRDSLVDTSASEVSGTSDGNKCATDEKMQIITHLLEQMELGIGEAQVIC
jgi:hypothetical protein